MDLDSTNGTFINVRFLVICVLICQMRSTGHILTLLLCEFHCFCREIALSLGAIMSYLKRIHSSLATVGMILTT